MDFKIIGFGGHDLESSATLLVGGKLIAAAQEERFNRVTHVGGFPYRAIDYCLKEAGLNINDIDYFTYPFKDDYSFYLRHTASNLITNPSEVINRFSDFKKTLNYRIHKRRHFRGELQSVFSYRLGIPENKIKFFDHHACHFASAFYSSGFEEAAGLTIDLEGDGSSTCGWVGREGKTKKVLSFLFPNSLGILYNRVTNFLGFKTHDEYKVMGLAAYGRPAYDQEFKKLLALTDAGYQLNGKYFDPLKNYLISPEFSKLFGPPYQNHDSVDERMTDIACSLQKIFEDAVIHLARIVKSISRSSNIVLAGGCSLNSKANGVLLNENIFKEIYIPAVAGDCGVSLGAAYLQHASLTQAFKPKRIDSDALGPSFSAEQIKKSIEKGKLAYTYHEHPEKTCAQLLASGKIVGWFQGRMEFGPRALGQRSILADARDASMKGKVNAAVKFREGFRPFAPICKLESAREFFNLEGDAPFMTFTVKVKEHKRDDIPAVVHHDGTSRVQTVDKNVNPLLHSLLDEFENITGVPVLLNTSFNVAGEPIVCTPDDAIRTFFTSGLDALFMENFLLSKN
jgi:carbamoyltransferase